MTIEVELFDDLETVARDAAGALDRATQAHLYDRLDWFRLTREHVLGHARIVVARARDGARCGWLFLIDLGGRRAEAFASWYTLAYRPVFAGDPDDPRRVALVAAMAAALAPRFDRISLAPVPPPDDATLTEGFAAGGWISHVSVASANWRIDVEHGDYASYWSARPARLRNTVRRKSALTRVNINIVRFFDPDVWADYELVYARSWKPAEGSRSFLRALAGQEGDSGTLRLAILYEGDSPIAAQFWLVENGVATIHKVAYLEDARNISPGTLLSAAMFRTVIDDDQPAVIDFGTGDDAYKADWMDTRTDLYRIEFARSRSAAAAILRLRSAWSRLVRRSESD